MIYQSPELPHIHHPDFDDPKAVREILSFEFDPDTHSKITNHTKYDIQVSAGVLTTLAEISLFKKLNLLKKADFDNGTNTHFEEIQNLRSLIVFYNIRLICKMFVLKYKSKKDRLEDYLSDGTFTLYKAVDKFDVSTGYKFSTYAAVAILRSLNRFVSKARLTNEMGWVEDKSTCLYRMAEDKEFTHKAIKKLLNSGILNQRELEIIRLRYGFYDGSRYEKPHTLIGIAEKFGISKERVRQIMVTALDKSQSYLKEHGYDFNYLQTK